MKETKVVSSAVPTMCGNSYRYKTKKGEISLLYPCFATHNYYEIYCIEGDLFDDIERFDTLGEAKARIAEVLQ